MRLLGALILGVALYGTQIDALLDLVEERSDLSWKTKEKNSGITYIFTRRDLEVMHALHLRDVLKETPIGYKLNRYGILDPLAPFTTLPFMASSIKLFIDDHELFSGLYNSGLGILGDIELGFVDHIEIYIQNPSLRIIQEPCLAVIKLYTKTPQRDSGSELLVAKSRSSLIEINYADGKDFYLHASLDEERREDTSNLDGDSSKKIITFTQDFGKHHLNLFYLQQHLGGLIGPSLDGKVQESFIKGAFFHAGYGYKDENSGLLLSFNQFRSSAFYKEEPLLMFYRGVPITSSYVASGDYTFDTHIYQKITFGKDELLYGLKYRYKHFRYDHLQYNGIDNDPTDFNNQQIASIYFQNDYFVTPEAIFNLGASYARVRNNASMRDYHTLLVRSGVTFNIDGWIILFQYSHLDLYPDPYLLPSIYMTPAGLDMVEVDNYLVEVSKEFEKWKVRWSVGYLISPNFPFPNTEGLLENLDHSISEWYVASDIDYTYRPFNRIALSFYMHHFDDLPIGGVTLRRIVLRHFQDYGRWRIYMSLLYNDRESRREDSGIDASFSISYSLDEDLSVFFKGENIFDSSIDTVYLTYDPLTLQRGTISLPQVERSFWVGVRWNF